ncbi:hypothetical protein DPMN_032743 [Dreissena polymorpha]|uniref:Uncharacterized protein n=1 Tax=Dreissena polymorpha TaxID=45954 RepID=A0A9D4M5B1_DREPO|nr:hypothetical protein DPMN_032743 [Dreissena polymorpha]
MELQWHITRVCYRKCTIDEQTSLTRFPSSRKGLETPQKKLRFEGIFKYVYR